jgi:hypothetical protein
VLEVPASSGERVAGTSSTAGIQMTSSAKVFLISLVVIGLSIAAVQYWRSESLHRLRVPFGNPAQRTRVFQVALRIDEA